MAPILGIIASSISGNLTPTTGFCSISTTTVVPGGALSITFSNIPQVYKHLQIRSSVLLTSANNIKMQMNGDTGGNYSWHNLTGNGTSASSSNGTNTVFMYAGFYGGVASTPQAAVTDILDYTNTNKYKTIRVLEGNNTNGSGTYGDFVGLWSGSWRSTSAVTSITLYPTSGLFNTNAKIALYGIQG